ncbi:hypothetical protein FKW77_004610 [Venturia effusa]|uniref:F-box domain-containing protein n=1 Tax=Venturia effusa TaxID=50376 RepID=A0A517L5B0_9PEZI|nr:hypothetical protein FKW77_004610 [Venturia effusa]
MFSPLACVAWPQKKSEPPARTAIQWPSHDKNGQPLRASLLGIPGELRNSIYKLLFPDFDKDITRLQVLLTCRQIYHEAALRAFTFRRFVIGGKDKYLAVRLSCLSQEQKDMIKIVERPEQPHHSIPNHHFYMAVERHLRPSCLLLGTNESIHILSAIVRIQSLTHIFAHSQDGYSIGRLKTWHWDMMKYNNCSIAPFKVSLDMIRFTKGTDIDCVL